MDSHVAPRLPPAPSFVLSTGKNTGGGEGELIDFAEAIPDRFFQLPSDVCDGHVIH